LNLVRPANNAILVQTIQTSRSLLEDSLERISETASIPHEPTVNTLKNPPHAPKS